ncbi:hypothetical protein ACFU96_43955 [Streptomyces sp. NPDC057620]|uniref:hypothetical protein n=1 Tax=Streptomyces sp. NPDC057620 TaxID=3346185 RepID=UPI0036A2E7B0
MASRRRTPWHIVRDLVRALLGLAGLLALLAAVPYVLLLFDTQPTDWSGNPTVLLRPDDGTLLLTACTCIGWAAWATFAYTVILEIVAVARRRSAPRLRPVSSVQAVAAFLVGAIALIAPAASAAPSSPTPAVTAPPSPSAKSSSPGAAPNTSAAARAAQAPTHTVASSTELPWDLAERYLGAGQRWRDIAALNPDVAGLAAGDQYLPEGAVIKLPADARPAAKAATGKRERASTVTVRSCDYLSKIARQELGDGDRWPELFAASRSQPQPRGLPEITDPDLIYAGQQITVPDAPPTQADPPREAEERSRPPAAPPPSHDDQQPGHGAAEPTMKPSRSTPAPHPSPSSAAGTPSTTSTRQPEEGRSNSSVRAPAAPRPSTSTSATRSAAPSSSQDGSPTAAPPDTPGATAENGPGRLLTVLGAGALLASAITGALALRRTLQRRRRTPGEKIAIAAQPSAAEAQLAAAAEPGAAARLDVALRTLAHQWRQKHTTTPLPALRAARLGLRTAEVLPDDRTQAPPAPFKAGQGGWWSLPTDAALLDDDTAREVPAPYPGLVTIGSTAQDELLLLDLCRLPALLLDGDQDHVTEVCTALALELGMSPWAHDVEIVTIGFGEDLPQLLPTARIAHMRDARHALQDLGERLLEAHQMPETGHMPYLLLCASALDADTAWEFADIIDKATTLPVTLVAPAGSAAAHFPEADVLDASLRTPQHLGYADTDITVQRLEHNAYLQITAALQVSGQPPHAAEGPWRDVPVEPERHHHAAETVAAGRAAPTNQTATTSSSADDAGTDVFPALLAASTGPATPRSPLATAAPGAGSSTIENDADPATGRSPSPPVAAPNSDQSGVFATTPPAQDNARDQEHDAGAPEIRVLGPVEVTGVGSTGHGPRIAQLAVLLYFRPGRSADLVCADMEPVTPWTASTLNARLRGLRRCLGNDPHGIPYVPRRNVAGAPYQLAPSVQCDWTRFLHLVEHALPLGASGLPDLERALRMVRGRPFGGRPLPWAEPYQQEMSTRIVDVAHTVALHRTVPGPGQDLGAARRAVAVGLDVDDTAELLYRDSMRIEAAAGNRQGLHTAIARVQHVNRMLDCSLEMETEQLINELLSAQR